MTSLEEALAAKTLELETLQRSFDEYLESSKDLESELEKSLADAEAKLATSENKRRSAEEKLKALQDQCSYYEKASNSTNDELAKLREKVELLEKQKVKSEIENEDLSNQLRVLESNEESMREKINKLEEEVILANSEIENVTLASKDNERRLLDRIEELVSLSSASEATASSAPAQEERVENVKAKAVPPVEAVEIAFPTTSTVGSLTPKPPAEIPPQERGRIFEDDFVVKRKITDALATADTETIRGELLNMWNKYEALKSHNIKLLYKIQSLRGNIQVCCRTRPLLDHELRAGGQLIVDASDDSELLCFDSKTEFWKPFVFDRVWSVDATQTDVFLDMEPLVLAVLDGYNSCIMAYGQTGSGKTFTMEGSNVQLGVNYRAVLQIFEVLESRRVAAETMRKKMQQGGAKASNGKTPSKAVAAAPAVVAVVEEENSAPAAGGDADESVVQEAVVSVLDDPDVDAFRYKIEISMLEIYNEQVFDLLVDDRAQSEASALDIRQAPDGGITVPGLRQTEVRSAEEAIAVFQRGSRNRATASTNLNEHSSRSHLVIQIDVTVAPPGESSVRGRLLLVDLAGSERVSKSGVTGTAMKEAQFINKSLLALGDVMEALDQKQKYVPYRNSKLTFLLQNALGGNSKTALIVTLCPTDANADETLFTLHFASRVRNISLGAAAKYSNSKNLEVAVKNLRIEVKELRRKKALVEEALVEAKKDAKKATDKSFSLQDTKLKSLEENKRAAELLVQQLSKQLHDANHKYGEEHARIEKLLAETDLTQKNLRRALEQIKELQQENERVSQALHSKERELESVQAALLRALADKETRGEASAADGHGIAATQSPRQSLSPQRQEKVRVSFTFNEFGGTADVSKDNGRVGSATKPVNPRLLALTTDTASSKAKIQSPRGSNGAPSPARRESFPLSKASSLLRTPTTPSTTTASSAAKHRDTSANRLVRSTTAKEQVTPSTATRKSIGSSALLRTPTTPAPSSTTAHHAHTPSTAMPAPRSSTSRSLTPTMIPKRSSPAPVHTSSAAPTSSAEARTGSLQKDRPKVERSLTPTYVPFSSPSAADIVIRDAAASSLHAATRQAVSASSGDLSKRVVSLNNRTEDALRRHQERMGKRREASSTH